MGERRNGEGSVKTNAVPEAPGLAVSIQRAAELLGNVSYMAVWRMARTGEIRSFKIGTRRLISMQALEDYIAEQERQEAAVHATDVLDFWRHT
jgi:excisionase family DNA binding protein